MSTESLAAKYLAKLEQKNKLGATQLTISRNLNLFADSDDGVISFTQFARSLELLGTDTLTTAEAHQLFASWEQSGCVRVEHAVGALLQSTGQYTREFDVYTAGDGNKSNLPSHPDGPFGGGAYASETTGQQLVAELTPTSGGGNRSNESSVEGGIFAGQTEAERLAQQQPPRANKRNANNSSVPGGIFGPDF